MQVISKRNGLIIKSKTKWIYSHKSHPTDRLKIKLILDEKIRGNRIIGLEARIESGDIHQLHIHKNEYVLVYSLKGKCIVTVGRKTKTVFPNTMIFIPPKVPHRFYNKFSNPWEGIAFAIGTRTKINNIWIDDKKRR